MKICKCDSKIVCDIVGCGKIADYFIINKPNDSQKDSLKLCKKCLKELNVEFNKVLNKKEKQFE